MEPDRQPVRTTCPYCGVGCGVLATKRPDGSVEIAGDPDHPANFGRLCSKGSALAETIGLDGRLLFPQIAGRRASWDEALDLVAGDFAETIRDHGPDSVAFYVSGQLLTRGLLRRQQADEGLHRLGQHRHQFAPVHGVFGRRPPPRLRLRHRAGHATKISNLPISSCSSAPISPGAIRCSTSASPRPRRKRPAMRVVLVDPRRTMTADLADLHLAIAPDGDVALFNGLLAYLANSGALDRDYIARAYDRLRRGACGRQGARARIASIAATGLGGARTGAASMRCLPRRAKTVTSSARASTSRRSAPTRSTPSSTAIWRPAASASPGQGRSR